MKIFPEQFVLKKSFFCGLGLVLACGTAVSHDVTPSGAPVCLEGNFMVADAQYAPFAAADAGRVLEMNITTGERGITVDNPFNPDNAGTPICPNTVSCAIGASWKPTGVASGGVNGHPLIAGEAQGTLTEFHRDGTPIRSIKFPTRPVGDANGDVPRPLGAQFMPNGNFVQTICDTNFSDAPNSDPIPAGEPNAGANSSTLYFPPTYDTQERASNSRLLVLDQESMEIIDEYTRPAPGELGHDLWNCMADVAFTGEGMFMSLFHGAAILVIDWKAGLDNEKSEGIGSNQKDKGDDDGDDSVESFKMGKPQNRSKVIRVIDLLEDGDPNTPPVPADDPMRRDALRAITFDENGTLYATMRQRSRPCLRGEIPGTPGGCNPGVFRQRVSVVEPGDNYPSRTIALDPGINVIAGIRTNRMSGVACEAVNPGHTDPDACDVETLLVAASAFNPGCTKTGPVGANPCFTPGGGVAEYSIDPADADDPVTCTGAPSGVNTGCALPIATFEFRDPQITGPVEPIDPRMLMTIHEAFVQ